MSHMWFLSSSVQLSVSMPSVQPSTVHWRVCVPSPFDVHSPKVCPSLTVTVISAVLPALSVTTIFCSPCAGARVKLPVASSVTAVPFTVTVSTYFSVIVTVCASQ